MKIEEKIYKKIKQKGYKLTTAESCTGGLLVGKIINVAGASDIVDMSFVTYSNEAKCSLVNVKKETIDKYNVVSEEVAKEMAIGAKNKAKCEIGLSTTGLAGPNGGDEQIPVGTVCFGIAIKDEVYTYRYVFKNISRRYIRNASVTFILKKLDKLLDC